MNLSRKHGFTLIEVLLVIAILAILAAIVIVAINPAKQLGDAQNAQRHNDVRAILDAIHQYGVDNEGQLPADNIPTGESCVDQGQPICSEDENCSGVNLEDLTYQSKYLTAIPSDPTGYTDDTSGYFIYKTINNRVGVCAPSATGDTIPEVMQ